MNGPPVCTRKSKKGRGLTSGARPVGRSTAFRLCGWGRRKQEGKGRELPSFPSSLLIFYIGVREAYPLGGGAGAVQPFPPPTILASSITVKHLSWK